MIFDPEILVAFDFDGTLTRFDDLYHEAPINKKAVKYYRKISKLHVKTVLWTCRNGKALDDCLQRLRMAGICFDYINNDNGKRNAGRKINADVYIDDKANDGKIRWAKTYRRIKRLTHGR